MSRDTPKKVHLRQILINYYFLNKTAVEVYRVLQKGDGEMTPNQKTCQDWFKRFKSDDFDVNDKEDPG